MAKKKTSKIVIEPGNRVVEALRLAVAEVGVDELLQRTSATPELLEKWINGEEWVPLNVVKEACDINRKNPEASSHFKILSECTAGYSFKIMVKKEARKPATPIVKEIIPPAPHIPAEKIAEPKAKALKPEAARQMVTVGTALFIIPILSVVIGFLLGGFMGAVVGSIFGFVIIMTFTFVFFVLLPKKSRRTDIR